MRYFNHKRSEDNRTVKSRVAANDNDSLSRKETQNYINHLGFDQHQEEIKHPKNIKSIVNNQKDCPINDSTVQTSQTQKIGNRKRTKNKNKFKNQSDQPQTVASVKPQILHSKKEKDARDIPENSWSVEKNEDNFVNSKRESNIHVISSLQDQSSNENTNIQRDSKSKNKYKDHFDQRQNIKSAKPLILDYKTRTYLLAKPGNRWYNQIESLNGKGNEDIPVQLISEMENIASKILQDDVELYIKKFQRERLSDFQWIKTVTVKGTLVDKMAALTIMIQDSPVHNLSSLDTLLNMSKKKERRENVIAMTTLKDLFITDLLPSNEKLKKFSMHPLNELNALTSGNKDHRDKCLLYWYFEHQLKERYCDFLKSLEAISFDPVESSKTKAVSAIFWLLSNRPEQEQILLTMLVNKLGDPVNKIASKAAHFLTMLVTKHSRMKFVVALDVERLLYRPNINPRAQYYAVCFLNQLILDPEDVDLAARLITIYLSFFKILIKKKEVDSKMLSALLTGVNRAYPFSKDKSDTIIEEIPTLFKIVHTMNFNVAVQTLMLLYQLLDIAESITDRFYTALYRKILDPELINCTRQTMFLNLLYKSLKKDSVTKRIKAFVKRLLQICNYHQPPFVCGVLILLSELVRNNPGLFDVSALQEGSDDEEYFVDLKAPDSDVENEGVIQEEKFSCKKENITVNKITSWVHRKNLLGKQTEHNSYDPYQRNPLYCGAEYSIFWELNNLNKHYHPSVALFAQKIITGSHIVYSGDPLEDFTNMHFLERFVYRNPKNISKMEKHPVSLHAKKVLHTDKSREVPVYSKEFINRKETNISPDELFLYRYLTERKTEMKNKDDSDESDNESIPDAEFDILLDKLENDKKKSCLDLDFAREFQKHVGEKKKKDESESESGEEFEEDNDEEVEFDDEEFKTAFKDFDMSKNEDGEDPEFEDLNDDDDDEMELVDELELGEELSRPKKSSKLKRTKKVKKEKIEADLDEEDFEYSDDDVEFNDSKRFPMKNKRNSSSGDKNLFAAAEKFSLLLEGDDDGNYDTSGSNAFANKDKAKTKQLKWEVDRDRWVRGVDWKSKKRMKSRKPFGKKNIKYRKKKY